MANMSSACPISNLERVDVDFQLLSSSFADLRTDRERPGG
jgi:hypothetical protein